MNLNETQNANRQHLNCNGSNNKNLVKFDQDTSLKKQRNLTTNRFEDYDAGYGQDFHQSVTETVRHLTARINFLIKLTITLMVIVVVLAIFLARLQCRVSEVEQFMTREVISPTQSDSFQAGSFHRADREHDNFKTGAGTQGYASERLARMNAADKQSGQRSDYVYELTKRGQRSTVDARKCSNLSIRVPEAFFPTVFDDNLYHEITNNKSLSKDGNCLDRGTWQHPEQWCVSRTITFEKRESPVRVFGGAPNDLISFNNITGAFTVEKSGSFLVFGYIPIISDKMHNHTLGLYLNNQTMLTCQSSAHAIVRTDNAASSKRKRICNLSGALMLKKGERLYLKTMVRDLQLHLDRPAYLSWILLSSGSNQYEWQADRFQNVRHPKIRLESIDSDNIRKQSQAP